ncbi:FkbM family methyltransferase [Butyrivibrio sp. AE2032]|uniref:FkbM family methyltransferase n=1 Tax=Butyrivibrio sp. AE2032 TaxID=1458463 RepID=UPI00055916FC|nr:FkbM family methyltransferase [Butyrivibrio sp. AE2032]
MAENSELEKKYLSLIRGLDGESISIVNRILLRQSQYLSSDLERIDLFTINEQDELRRIDDLFSKEIVRITDELYAYRQYRLPINHFEPVVFYHKYCLNELADIERLKGKTIIDAGGFIGDTALIFSELSPDRIISFEPMKENIELFHKTMQLNYLTNVTLEQKALGAEPGVVTMYYAGEGSTSYPRNEDRRFYSEPYEVPVVTLDEYVRENELKVGLVKMDIEGSESDCLKGAKRLIAEQRPILLICIYHNKNDFFGIKTMLEDWGIDYNFKIRKPTVSNATYETMLIAEPK